MTLSHPFNLAAKRALITGSTGGLGREMARGLAEAGAHVVLHGRDPAKVRAAVVRLESENPGRQFSAIAFDLGDSAATEAAMHDLGPIDILVNNAGVRDRRPLAELGREAVRALFEIDLVAPFDLARLAAAQMGEGSRIINICSIAGPLARGGDAAYTSAKGGLAALTRALAAELGPRGITVNGIAPGYFATEANSEMAADPDIAAWLAKRTSLGRWGRPEEIAGAAVFLASAAASFITGHILAVDGGHLAHF